MFSEIICFSVKDAAIGKLSVGKSGRGGESFVQEEKNRDI